MKLRRLNVTNFRGIKSLNWLIPDEQLVALVGAGDSRKTTILEAISMTLSPQWSLPVDDADFCNLDCDNPIRIEATIGDIMDPSDENAKELIKESNFGLNLAAIKDGGLTEELGELEPTITISLTVDKSLQPEWHVIAPGREPKPIGPVHRALVGAIKLKEYKDNQFSWARNSLLTRLMKSDIKSANVALADVSRQLRATATATTDFKTEAKRIELIVKEYGVKANSYDSLLDIQGVSVESGGFSLHDGNVPIRTHGTGSKRLISIGLQQSYNDEKSLTLVDEIEHGLEPHRIAHLLTKLKEKSKGQVIFTSHSPVVMRSLKIEEVNVVREKDQEIRIVNLEHGLEPATAKVMQRAVVVNAEALFAPRIIVAEGVTEQGMLRAYDKHRQSVDPTNSFTYSGIATVDGVGMPNCSKIALKLNEAGYDVALFCDSDRAVENEADLIAANVDVIRWDSGNSTEKQIFNDADSTLVEKLVDLAVSYRGLPTVRDEIQRVYTPPVPKDRKDWKYDDADFCEALAISAGNCSWYKHIDRGEDLGNALIPKLGELGDGSNIVKVMSLLQAWFDRG
jgi:putative ATP-dependent endonuclease of the OLD family